MVDKVAAMWAKQGKKEKMKRTITVPEKLNLQTSLREHCVSIWVGLQTSSHDLTSWWSPNGVVPRHLAEANTAEPPLENSNDPQASRKHQKYFCKSNDSQADEEEHNNSKNSATSRTCRLQTLECVDMHREAIMVWWLIASMDQITLHFLFPCLFVCFLLLCSSYLELCSLLPCPLNLGWLHGFALANRMPYKWWRARFQTQLKYSVCIGYFPCSLWSPWKQTLLNPLENESHGDNQTHHTQCHLGSSQN